ncbi:ATP-binding protein [Marinicella meishanensis]|uniref:ATP-binding protein n=1 Tax=Marinicella meishanensis TaxID=2873263 RepID=UPI001CBD9A57|nr:ATP-binding protein [Marinicella sp. NBU2979]
MARPVQAAQFSNRLFTRFYVVLVATLIIISSGIEYVLNRMDEADALDQTIQSHQPIFSLVGQLLADQEANVWDQSVMALQPQFQQPLLLVSLADFAADQSTLTTLQSGQVLALFDASDNLTLYRRLGDSDRVLGLPANLPEVIDQRSWVLPVFYALLALVLFVLIRPFARQLIQLKQAALDLGSGDFTARVEVPASTTLAPIADAFNAMTLKIKRLMQTQRDLVNAVSHELRTPLARMKFSFEELSMNPDAEQVKQSVAAMRDDVKELEQLIDEMLRYAEVNQIKAFAMKAVGIQGLLEDLVASHHQPGIDLQLHMADDIDEDHELMCHELSVIRALSNVLRNALSFAQQQCVVSAHLASGALVIEINDDGPGLGEVNTERLFEPFFRVSQAQRKSGYGLGLSIAHTITQKHQGHLQVATGQLPGACFRFTLPLA